MPHDRPARGRLLAALRATPVLPAWPHDRAGARSDRSLWPALFALGSCKHLDSARGSSGASAETQDVTDHEFGALFRHEMPAVRKGFLFESYGDHRDHFTDLSSKAFLAAKCD